MAEGFRPPFKFRLIELVVLFGCLFVLAGIFLPAVHYTNHSASRSFCQNNLRQIIMAATNFEAQSSKLPTNRQTRPSQNGLITMGWVYDILPYLEDSQQYDLLKKDAADAVANSAKMPFLICPSDQTAIRPTDISYVVNGGCPNNPADNFDSPANGVGDDLAGTYAPRQRAVVANCKDGATMTLFYIENLNAQRWNEDFYHPATESHEYFHVVLWLPVKEDQLASVFQTTKKDTSEPTLLSINSGDFETTGQAFARPSSSHPGGFNSAFVGGNTRHISEIIDYRVYAQLLSSHSARTLDPADTSESRTIAIRAWQKTELAPKLHP